MNKVSFLKVVFGAIAAHLVAILSIVILAMVFPGFNPYTVDSDFGIIVVSFTTIALSGIPTAVVFWPLSYYGLVSSARTYLVGVCAFTTTLGLLIAFDKTTDKSETLIIFSCLIILLQAAFWYLFELIDTNGNNQSIQSGDSSINVQVGKDYRSK